MPDKALHRPHRAISESTNRVALDFARHVIEHIDLRDRGIAGDHAFQHAPDPTAPLATGRALAAALVLVEPGEDHDRLDDVGGFVHHDQRGGAERALDLDQGVEIHQHRVANVLWQHRGRGPARDHAEQIVPTAAYAARVLFDQLAHRDAHRLLDIAGLLDMTGNAENLRPGVAGPADAGKP